MPQSRLKVGTGKIRMSHMLEERYVETESAEAMTETKKGGTSWFCEPVLHEPPCASCFALAARSSSVPLAVELAPTSLVTCRFHF